MSGLTRPNVGVWEVAVPIVLGVVAIIYGVAERFSCLGPEALFIGVGIALIALGIGFLRAIPVAAFIGTIGIGVAIFGYVLAPTGHC